MAWDSQVTYLRLLFRAKKALDTGETHLNFIDKTPYCFSFISFQATLIL